MIFENKDPDYHFYFNVKEEDIDGCRILPQGPEENVDMYEVQIFVPMPPHQNWSGWVGVITSKNKEYVARCMTSISQKCINSKCSTKDINKKK